MLRFLLSNIISPFCSRGGLFAAFCTSSRGVPGNSGRLGWAVLLFYTVEGAGILGRLSVAHGESLCGDSFAVRQCVDRRYGSVSRSVIEMGFGPVVLFPRSRCKPTIFRYAPLPDLDFYWSPKALCEDYNFKATNSLLAQCGCGECACR